MRISNLVRVLFLSVLLVPASSAESRADITLSLGVNGSVGAGLGIGLRGQIPLVKQLTLGLGYRAFEEISGADGHDVFVGAHWAPTPGEHFRPLLGVGVDVLNVDVHEIRPGDDLRESGMSFGAYLIAGARWHSGHFVFGVDGRFGTGASLASGTEGAAIDLAYGQIDLVMGYVF